MRERRLVLLCGLGGTLLLLGVGCAPDDEEASGGGFQPGPLGAVTIPPGQPIHVGAIQVVSGDSASGGTDQVRGMEIAIADRDGELLGHPIELQVEDGECRAEAGAAAAQRLVSEPDLVGVIGPSCSNEAVPAGEILVEEGIVMISASTTAPALTSDLEGNEGDAHQEIYYRVSHNDLVEGQAAATFAYEELGATDAVTIHDGDPYTQGLTAAFAASFRELGGDVVLGTAVRPDDTDMRPVLTEAAAVAPDLVYAPLLQPAADHIVAQAKEFEPLVDATMMGAAGLLADTFVVRPDSEGMYFSGPATPEGPAYQELVDKYEETYGEAPIQAFHAHAYDAINLLLTAIEAVAVEEADGTLQVDRQALMDELHATRGFDGLTGTLTCDEFGDCADPRINIVRNTAAEETLGEVRANVLYTFDPGD